MALDRVEHVDHVLVAQVPRQHTTAEHRPVVLRGIADDHGVLLGICPSPRSRGREGNLGLIRGLESGCP
jgi:hypothetical protein